MVEVAHYHWPYSVVTVGVGAPYPSLCLVAVEEEAVVVDGFVHAADGVSAAPAAATEIHQERVDEATGPLDSSLHQRYLAGYYTPSPQH